MRIALINIIHHTMSGGYFKYLKNILLHLSLNENIIDILCVMPEQYQDSSEFINSSKIKYFYTNINYIKPRLNSSQKSVISNFNPDLIFIPTDKYLKFKNVPTINMLQNMEPYIRTNYDVNRRAKIRLSILKRTGIKAIKSSKGTITVSKFVFDYLNKEVNVPEHKLFFIPFGIESQEEFEDAFTSNNTSEDEFIFTAGSIRPSRGLEDIINAVRELHIRNIKVRVLIAGEATGDSQYYYKQLKELVNRHRLEDYIVWCGKLSDEEMTKLYSNCKIFIMSSRVESFGMISLEALKNGCVCIAANNPCHPEIFGASAIYYRPKDSTDLADKVEYLLSRDIKEINSMKFEAKKRAKEFSWQDNAKRTVEFFKLVKERVNDAR